VQGDRVVSIAGGVKLVPDTHELSRVGINFREAIYLLGAEIDREDEAIGGVGIRIVRQGNESGISHDDDSVGDAAQVRGRRRPERVQGDACSGRPNAIDCEEGRAIAGNEQKSVFHSQTSRTDWPCERVRYQRIPYIHPINDPSIARSIWPPTREKKIFRVVIVGQVIAIRLTGTATVKEGTYKRALSPRRLLN
jgi:hypothetical protein